MTTGYSCSFPTVLSLLLAPPTPLRLWPSYWLLRTATCASPTILLLIGVMDAFLPVGYRIAMECVYGPLIT